MYHIDANTKVIGAGAFGKVFLTHQKKYSDFQVAIKVLNKIKLQDSLEAIEDEIDILTNLDHPNIVKYYEKYKDEESIYIVMEYISGGELFNKISSADNQVLTEDVAKKYMFKLFSACNHMHS